MGDEGSMLIEIDLALEGFDDWSRYITWRNKRFIPHPCLAGSWRNRPFDDSPTNFWALALSEPNNFKTQPLRVLDYCECYGSSDLINQTSESPLPFGEWLSVFPITSRSEAILAPDLFRIHRYTGQLLPSPPPNHDPWLDGKLRRTRGLLIWKSQVIDVIQSIGGFGHSEADKLRRGYGAQKPDALDVMQKIRYPATEQTLLEILDERSDNRRYLGTYPNRALALWLRRRCLAVSQR